MQAPSESSEPSGSFSRQEIETIFHIARGLRSACRVWPALKGLRQAKEDSNTLRQWSLGLMSLPFLSMLSHLTKRMVKTERLQAIKKKLEVAADDADAYAAYAADADAAYAARAAADVDANAAAAYADDADVDANAAAAYAADAAYAARAAADVDARAAARVEKLQLYRIQQELVGEGEDVNVATSRQHLFILKALSEFLNRPLWEGAELPPVWESVMKEAGDFWKEIGLPEVYERYDRYCRKGIDFEEMQVWILGEVVLPLTPQEDGQTSLSALILDQLKEGNQNALIQLMYRFVLTQPKHRSILTSLEPGCWRKAAQAVGMHESEFSAWPERWKSLERSIESTLGKHAPEPNPLWMSWMREVQIPKMRTKLDLFLAKSLRASLKTSGSNQDPEETASDEKSSTSRRRARSKSTATSSKARQQTAPKKKAVKKTALAKKKKSAKTMRKKK